MADVLRSNPIPTKEVPPAVGQWVNSDTVDFSADGPVKIYLWGNLTYKVAAIEILFLEAIDTADLLGFKIGTNADDDAFVASRRFDLADTALYGVGVRISTCRGNTETKLLLTKTAIFHTTTVGPTGHLLVSWTKKNGTGACQVRFLVEPDSGSPELYKESRVNA